MPITITADSHAAADDAWRALCEADLPTEGAILQAPGQTLRVSRDANGQMVLERLE